MSISLIEVCFFLLTYNEFEDETLYIGIINTIDSTCILFSLKFFC